MNSYSQLRRIPLFAQLDECFLAKIAGIVREQDFQKGQFIFFEGDPGKATYLLKNGRVKLTRQSADGKEHILKLVKPGEVFAEVALIDGGN